jgi:ribosome-binding ATPase YchF (GTP1/OBG family)
LIRAGYHLLDLITYFTVGPKETRAWTVVRGAKAPAGRRRHTHRLRTRLHSRLQTIAYDDYVALGGEVPAKEAGKSRDEGKEYVVQDGDVLHFRFNT